MPLFKKRDGMNMFKVGDVYGRQIARGTRQMGSLFAERWVRRWFIGPVSGEARKGRILPELPGAHGAEAQSVGWEGL